MPRPKRAKIALATTRVAKTSKPADPAPRKTKAVDTQTNTVFVPSESFSEDSDGLVVKSTRPRRRMPWQPEPQGDVDFTMTGALPLQTEDGSSKKSKRSRTPSSKLSKKTRASSNGASSVTRKSPTVVGGRRSHPTRGSDQDVPAPEEDSSTFGDHLLSFTSLDSESPAHGTRPPSAIKIGTTPAHETSILALTNFKRRPRQPSLLRMVQQTTDVEDNDLDDLGDFDDFNPDAESTPLYAQKNISGEIGNDSGVNLSSSGSRGTKRKLSPVIQVPQSSPTYDSGPDVTASRSPSPSLPEVIHSTEDAHTEDPDRFSETMAPPLSSSDCPMDEIDDDDNSPLKPKQRRKRGASAKAGKAADSEGEETERPKSSKGRRKPKTTHGISTAKLQAMLPRRRRRIPQGDGEDDMSEDAEVDSDQDELALPQRRRRTATARKSSAPKSSKKASRATKKSTTSSKTALQNTRTYGRRTSSDKENEDAHEQESDEEEGSTIEVTTVKPSATLEALAKKFEEVDDFELDFESVSYVPTSSSPYR